MADNTKGLKEYAKQRSQMALDKVDKAIRELSLTEQKINFNSVSQLSGVSKTFLYNNEEVKKRIEELRDKQVSKTINQRAKYDKTSKAKDIIIMAKDKKIKELEEENKSKEKAYNDCYCEYKHYKQFDSISTQKVKDILNEIQEEYNKLEEQFDCIWDKKSKDNYDRYKLQELSAMQQELGFILGKFEELLEEGE